MCPTPCIWPLLPIPLLLLFLLFPSGAIFTVHTRTSLERRHQEMINSLKIKEREKMGFGQKGMAPKKLPMAENWTMAPLAPLWPSSSEIPHQTKAKNSLEEEQHIINRLLSSDKNAARELYDWRVRPKGNLAALPSTKLEQWGDHYDGPVMVDVNMYLRSISKVDDVNMEFTMHFTFRQEWVDERLYFNSPSLKYIVLVANEHSQRIFLPDTFFQNEKDGRKHNVDKPNVFIRVHNGTGRVLYSSRMTLTLSCPMYLQAYPLDTQTCFIDYASYAYTTKDLEYRWRQDGPIQLKHGLRQSLPSFVLSSVTTGNCTSVTNTGTYSCLRTILRLRREFSYYLLQLYVPSFMLVAVSTVSFWLDKDSVPARITLGTTVLLTVTTMASGINAKLPPVSYTKSVDIWIGVCTGFIFAALLEFSLVNWAARKELASQARANRMCTNPLLSAFQYRQEQQRRLSAMDNAAYGELGGGGGGKQRFRSASTATTSRWNETDLLNWVDRRPAAPLSRLLEWWDDLWTNRYREKSRRIDLMARVLFPLFFILFNIIYWTAYLTPYLAEDIHAMDRPKKNGSGVG